MKPDFASDGPSGPSRFEDRPGGPSGGGGVRAGVLMDAIKRGFRFVRRHPIASAEILVGTHVVWQFATNPDVRLVLRLLTVNAFESLRSTWTLLQIDPQGTLESLGWTASTMLIATLPLLVLALRWRGWARLQFVWLPILYYFWPLVGTAPLAVVAGVSVLALWLIRFRWLHWTAFLPLAVMCAPVPIHQYSVVRSRAALLERCATNDGRRPINLTEAQIKPSYAGVAQLRPGELLLPGTGGNASWWLRRSEDGWKFEAPSSVGSSSWKGCLIGDELWLFLRPYYMVGVRRDAATGSEVMRQIQIPSTPMDFGEVVCVPEDNRVLITEAITGSAIWQVNATTGAVRRWDQDVGGIGSMARRGTGDRLIAGAGSDLVVYSLRQEEAMERTPAGVQMFGGIDVCPHDGEVALADLAGRVRFFKLDADGHYRFDWGIGVSAPRMVAYSPDCQHVAVTSWDDESVYLIDQSTQRRVATYRVGPALRGVTFLGPRELAVVDACTLTDIVF